MNEHKNNPDEESGEVVDTLVETTNSTAEAVDEPTAEVVADIVAEPEITEPPLVEDSVETPVKEAEEKDVAKESEEALVTAATATPLLTKVQEFVSAKRYTIAAVVLVLVGILGLMYIMESQGKINTGIFDGVDKHLAKYKTAAVVNGGKISIHDVNISTAQIATGAAAQGADIEDPKVKAEIQTQALDMLVNTELLKQEAAARGIVVTEEDVQARLATLQKDVGGEEVLAQRMTEFDIDEKTLLRDIKNELTIQKLLDEVFKEKSIEVTEEEVTEFYNQAGGEKAGLPALEEVRTQIETQIKTGKEQEVVTSYIEELRGKATIETKI